MYATSREQREVQAACAVSRTSLMPTHANKYGTIKMPTGAAGGGGQGGTGMVRQGESYTGRERHETPWPCNRHTAACAMPRVSAEGVPGGRVPDLAADRRDGPLRRYRRCSFRRVAVDFCEPRRPSRSGPRRAPRSSWPVRDRAHCADVRRRRCLSALSGLGCPCGGQWQRGAGVGTGRAWRRRLLWGGTGRRDPPPFGDGQCVLRRCASRILAHRSFATVPSVALPPGA